MAKDDYHVIVYKILAYFYGCLKSGKTPRREDYAPECEMFSIPESYWAQIMRELIENGYLRDIIVVPRAQGIGIKAGPTAAITMKGVEFLENNSGLRKAKEFLGKAFEVVLAQIIAMA